MFNYAIMRLPYLRIILLAFFTGVISGAPLGLMLGLTTESTGAGLLGGALFCLLCGACCGAAGFVFTLVFNVLSPCIGGLPVKLEAINTAAEAEAGQPPADAGGPSSA